MSRLLPYETIVKAHEGDPEAVDAVLSHYAGYIRYFSKMNGQVNAEVEDYVKERLIACLLKFQLVIYKRGCYSLRFFLYDEGDWLTEFPIGTPRPQTNVSASLHHSAFDSASWDKSLLPFHGLI